MTQKTSYFNEIFRMDVFCDEEKDLILALSMVMTTDYHISGNVMDHNIRACTRPGRHKSL